MLRSIRQYLGTYFAEIGLSKNKNQETATITADLEPVLAFSGIHKKSLRDDIPIEVGRELVAIKFGFPHLPATTVTTILQGFGEKIDYDDTLNTFASHGLSHGTQEFVKDRDQPTSHRMDSRH